MQPFAEYRTSLVQHSSIEKRRNKCPTLALTMFSVSGDPCRETQAKTGALVQFSALFNKIMPNRLSLCCCLIDSHHQVPFCIMAGKTEVRSLHNHFMKRCRRSATVQHTQYHHSLTTQSELHSPVTLNTKHSGIGPTQRMH